MDFPRYHFGRSYYLLVIAAFLLILGTLGLPLIPQGWNQTLSSPLYWLIVGLIFSAIAIPAILHDRLEKRVKEQDEAIYIMHLHIRILELEKEIQSREGQ